MRVYVTPSAAASDCASSEMRARLDASLFFREPQAVEAEPRLDHLRELQLEPRTMEVDRFVDLRRGRTRANDELGRQAVAHDHPMAAHALRPPHLQLDL